jgi:hypothetical protein
VNDLQHRTLVGCAIQPKDDRLRLRPVLVGVRPEVKADGVVVEQEHFDPGHQILSADERALSLRPGSLDTRHFPPVTIRVSPLGRLCLHARSAW